jgi:hypothetical protein
MAKCTKCERNEVSFMKRLTQGGLCEKCYNNEAQAKIVRDLVENGIDTLENLKENILEDPKQIKLFYQHFDDSVGGLYNTIYSSIISSLSSSIETTIKAGVIDRSEVKKLIGFLKKWNKLAENDDYPITTEEYNQFKGELTKSYNGEIEEIVTALQQIEEMVDMNGAIERLDTAIPEIENEIAKLEAAKIKERGTRQRIREKAERKVYGKVKTKRQAFTGEQKEGIFKKFNYKCAICSKDEGLHIHHKNQDPKDNQTDNLILLCGVCHKKVHMKVR